MPKITTIIENNPSDNNELIAEHGLSLYIECFGLKILFDTGQTGNFINNAKKLKLALNDLDYVILSHGHYDHSGGFKELLPLLNKKTKIILGDDFFKTKCKLLADGSYKYNGNSFSLDDIKAYDLGYTLVKEDLFKLEDNLYIIKNFKQANDYEIIPAKFQIEENNCHYQDNFSDEIALAINTDKGLVLVVGCSHRGIVNILEDVQDKLKRPIRSLIGGTHLVEADEERIKKTLAYLDQLNLEFVAFSHCTGKAITNMQEHFKDKFIFNNCGNVINID